MFDIGFTEILVIAVVALVVLGPERLPKAARFAGLWVRRARNQWDSVKNELERELAAEELKRNLDSVRHAVQRTGQDLRAGVESVQRDVEQAQAEIEQAVTPRPAGEVSPDQPAIAADDDANAAAAVEPAKPATPDPQSEFSFHPRDDR